MVNRELIKFVFNDSKTIKNNSDSLKFLKQILNAKTENIKLDIDHYGSLYVWEYGIWLDGFWSDGFWENGIWKDGTWKDGTWHNGVWKDGTWAKGFIYDPVTKQYKKSNVPPNECTWSLSYDK